MFPAQVSTAAASETSTTAKEWGAGNSFCKEAMAGVLRAQPMIVCPSAANERTRERPRPFEHPVIKIRREGIGLDKD
jgi:hypothetical protein